MMIDLVRIFQFQDALRHRLDDVRVPIPDLHQAIAEVLHRPAVYLGLFEFDHLLEAAHIPIVDRHHRRHLE